MDLYKILGVDRGADKGSIRRAYRRTAKSAHPDAGGNAKSFALVRLAHDVLTDEQRRQKYDATGEIEEKPIDNDLGNALQWVQMAVDHVLQACQQCNLDAVTVDILGDAKIFLNGKLQEFRTANAAVEKGIRQTEKVAKRFKPKRGKEDRLTALMAGRLASFAQQKVRNDGEIVKVSRALEIVADHSFHVDESEAIAYFEKWG